MRTARLAFLLPACLLMQAADPTAFDFSLPSLDGANVPLAPYKGKVLLVSVIADKSEYSGQLAKLDTLYKTHQAAGLVVLGVPTTNFGGDTLASNTDLKTIYCDQMKLSFPIFAPVEVRDKKKSFLFEFFSDHPEADVDGEVHWVFTKLLVNRAGKLVASFDAGTEPDSPELIAAIEKTLANQDLHPKKDDKKRKAKPESDSESER